VRFFNFSLIPLLPDGRQGFTQIVILNANNLRYLRNLRETMSYK
jgi:hypothetical protein